MEIISARDAAKIIQDDSVVIPGGFGCCGFPDALADSIAMRFSEELSPRNLTLLFASGGGDKAGKGLDRIARPGLIRRAIGGFWGFCPSLTKMAVEGKIDAHNWPMGVMSHLFRSMAEGKPGLLSHVGLGSFVDPSNDGGCLNERTSGLVSSASLMGRDYLFYPSVGADIALLRGTVSDRLGNISMSGEAALHDAYWQAMAVRSNGGKVIVQVADIVDSLPVRDVDVPAHLVDFVVIHGEGHRPSYGASSSVKHPTTTAKSAIVREALKFPIPKGAFVNFGIGIPALVGEAVAGIRSDIHTSIESGIINGTPKEGLSFGEAEYSQCIVQQADLFSFYDGGGIDIAYLGFAEIDRHGNVNASFFGDRITGVGGFINIALSAKKILLCGTFNTVGLEVDDNDGILNVRKEGRVNKFVEHVKQVTINTSHRDYEDKEIFVITERANFKIEGGSLVLIKVNKGVSVDSIIDSIPFDIEVKL